MAKKLHPEITKFDRDSSRARVAGVIRDHLVVLAKSNPVLFCEGATGGHVNLLDTNKLSVHVEFGNKPTIVVEVNIKSAN